MVVRAGETLRRKNILADTAQPNVLDLGVEIPIASLYMENQLIGLRKRVDTS